jgi:hypothetical protein
MRSRSGIVKALLALFSVIFCPWLFAVSITLQDGVAPGETSRNFGGTSDAMLDRLNPTINDSATTTITIWSLATGALIRC